MLKTKHLVILAVLLAVLAGIAIIQKTGHQRDVNRAASAVLIEGPLTRDGLQRIVLGRGDQPEAVVLERTPGGWEVATAWRAAASDQRIDALLRTLGGLAGEFRSDNAAVLADYGLAADEAVSIRAVDNDGGTVVDLLVGRTPPQSSGSFVRLAGQDAVYLSGKGLLAQLGIYGEPTTPTSRHFLDLEALQEERLDVDRVVLTDEHGRRTLVKEFASVPDTTGGEPQPDRTTWEWVLAEDGRDLAKTKADGVLGALVSIRATDVDDPHADAAAYGLEPPARTAVLVMEGGREIPLAFGAERTADGDRPAGTWLRIGDDPTVWIVTEYALNNIFKTAEDLLPGS